jgi:acyl dehydratase
MYSLSLISAMFEEAVPPIDAASANVNYGFDKVRFLSPVPSGSEIAGSFTLVAINERGKGQFLFRYNVTMNIKEVVKPAVHAEWLVMHVMA